MQKQFHGVLYFCRTKKVTKKESHESRQFKNASVDSSGVVAARGEKLSYRPQTLSDDITSSGVGES